jgi:hypothetical protein
LVKKEQGAAWTARLAAIAFPSSAVPELTHTAVIESSDEGMEDALRPWDGANSASRHAGEDTCRITIDESQRVVVENDLSAAGILVLADTFHSDWSASITADGGPVRPLPIMRANRIHRACILPRGRSVVEFRYRSATFTATWWLTVAGWLASAAAACVAGAGQAGFAKGAGILCKVSCFALQNRWYILWGILSRAKSLPTQRVPICVDAFCDATSACEPGDRLIGHILPGETRRARW